MAARTPLQFARQLLEEVGRRAQSRARPMIPSRTLRTALTLDIEASAVELSARLMIPHYWAVYLHDGRGAISKPGGRRRGGYLVFFRDPRDDPRTRGGTDYPERLSQVRQLTKAQFQDGLRRNREHLRNGGDPFTVPMIVVKRVGPVQPTPFFSEGMAGFSLEAGPLIARRFDQWISEIIRVERLHDKATATLRL